MLEHRIRRGSRTTTRTGLAILAVLIALPILSAFTFHHGWSNYHQDIELRYTGVITANEIGNPHTYIDLDVEERGGEGVARPYDDRGSWNVVLAPLTRMQNRGLRDNAGLAVGQRVTVVGYPHREVRAEMRAERIIIGNQTIELR
jgi:hypothetical protein